MSDRRTLALLWAYQAGSIATFAYLTIIDEMPHIWWRWAIAAACNVFLGEIWPIYWILLRPLMGA